MRPTLRDGALVEVAPLAKGERVAVGDVVLVRFGHGDVGLGGLVLHRVIDAPDAGGRLRTRGDGRRMADSPTERDAVLGRAVAVWLWGRRVDLRAPAARIAARLWTFVLPLLWPLRRDTREGRLR